MASLPDYTFETLRVTQPQQFVYNVELNRPNKLNAMNGAFWRDMRSCFDQIAEDDNCRVVVLSAAGRIFTAGLDLMDSGMGSVMMMGGDLGQKSNAIRNKISKLQKSFTAIEKCLKPVIAAIHSACVGGGVDMVTACDIRYCTQDAWFQVKEVDLGIAADVGTLQRLPRVVANDSLARELCYTARRMQSAEARECGLVSRVYTDREALMKGALDVAVEIASKVPVGVQGTKNSLVFSRDHSVEESLQHIAVWNQIMVQAVDIMEVARTNMERQKARKAKL